MAAMKQHLLVLSVSAGAGHVRAAQAVAAATSLKFPDAKVTHIDVLDLVPKDFRKLYSESYLKLVEKLPQLWAFLYNQADRRNPKSKTDRIRRAVEKLNTLGLRREIERLKPDAILCTHFLPAELLSRRIAKGVPLPPVWVQVTDFDVHALWIHPHMQGYFVANEEVAFRLQNRGIERQKIMVTGIPVMPQFAARLARNECAAELGIDAKRFTILMMAGGGGVGSLDELAAQLLASAEGVQLIVLAGRNEALLERLQDVAAKYPGKIFPLGFTTQVDRIMSACDLVITKPGGLSVSECLAKEKPMLLVSPIPGQEERNADFLIESGAALKAIDAATLQFKLQRLLADTAKLQLMSNCAAAVAKPHAASHVVDSIFATFKKL